MSEPTELNSIIQEVLDARVDMQSLSEFVWKPTDFMVSRRLAPPIHTLNYYLQRLDAVDEQFTAAVNKATTTANSAIDKIKYDASINVNNFIGASGFQTVDSFELGATITQRNQVLRHAVDGKLYRWAGNLPKVVPVGSTPTSSGGFGTNAWLEVSDTTLRQELTSNKGISLIGGLNIATPEQFGAVGDGIADDTVAVKAAFATGKNVYLTKTYGITRQIATTKAGQNVFGSNRKLSGLKLIAGWNVTGGNSVIRMVHNDCCFSDFTVDGILSGDGINSSGVNVNGVNGCTVGGDITGFSVIRVDAVNCSNYAHFAFGTEANPKTSGYYQDCRAENSLVLFEQQACHTVDLYSCVGVATKTTTDGFHPYASVKNINYVNCHLVTKQGSRTGMAGISIVTVNNYNLGTINFINCTMDIKGWGMCAFIDARTQTAKVNFVGGSYTIDEGDACAQFFGGVEVGIHSGAFFSGRGIYCQNTKTTISDSHIENIRPISPDAVSYALHYANSNNTVVTGGTLKVVGAAESKVSTANPIISDTTICIPPLPPRKLSIHSEGIGLRPLVPEYGGAYCNILTNHGGDYNKFTIQLTLRDLTNGDYIGSFPINWRLIDNDQVRVFVKGGTANHGISYRWVRVN